MSDRLPSGVLVGALLRRVADAGGFGTILARGDAQGGAILVVAMNRGQDVRVLERGIGAHGDPALVTILDSADSSGSSVTDYWQKRRNHDPDLWVIELDSAEAERFTAETIG